MTKLNKLYKYSDPEEVNKRARELHLNEIHPYSRANKKYMVFNGHNMVHFGAYPNMKIILSIIMRKEQMILI
jgi:hypothetical protein